MLVAEKLVTQTWVSVRDRLPFDGHECALICRSRNSNDLRRTIGCRLHGNWEIQDQSMVSFECPCMAKASFNARQHLRHL
jgi:hypothetical protein